MSIRNAYYTDTLDNFIQKSKKDIIGEISVNGRLGHNNNELIAWEDQIEILRKSIGKH
ncbi:hypothetical protein [Riemerella columbina]|uniref:hypothetical protein n=1 Tax=Riemerella columbina TaxID=103810 RepID=UPI00266F30CC|nr:hypothetical protein [Riemerella columbina]WKS94464.1 hypothetical protein NYR17_05855 [Riemerella columbina]